MYVKLNPIIVTPVDHPTPPLGTKKTRNDGRAVGGAISATCFNPTSAARRVTFAQFGKSDPVVISVPAASRYSKKKFLERRASDLNKSQ